LRNEILVKKCEFEIKDGLLSLSFFVTPLIVQIFYGLGLLVAVVSTTIPLLYIAKINPKRL